jgi:hypothetical protein
MSDPFYNDKMGAHYKTRDARRAAQTASLTSNAMKATVQELNYGTSAEVGAFRPVLQKKYENINQQASSRRMKLKSIQSD